MVHRSQYSNAYIMENLGRIQDHPYHGSNLGPALRHVQNIKATVPVPQNVTPMNVQVNVQASCTIHPNGGDLFMQGSISHDCIMCNLSRMVNVFGSTVDEMWGHYVHSDLEYVAISFMWLDWLEMMICINTMLASFNLIKNMHFTTTHFCPLSFSPDMQQFQWIITTQNLQA